MKSAWLNWIMGGAHISLLIKFILYFHSESTENYLDYLILEALSDYLN